MSGWSRTDAIRDASDLTAEAADDALGELFAGRDEWDEEFVPGWEEL